MRKLFSFTNNIKTFFFFLIFTIGTNAVAGNFNFLKKKKKDENKTTEVKKTPYEHALTDKLIMGSKGTFISLYKTDGKLLIDLPRTSIGKDMLIGATITSVSNPKLGELGFKNSNLVHIRFIEKDSVVVMQIVNTDLFYDHNNAQAAKSSTKNYNNLDFCTFPVKGRSKDNKSVLFDASSFFLKENRFFPIIETSTGSLKVSSSLKENLSRITELKTFDTNACIKMERSYLATISGSSKANTIYNYPVSIGVNFTIALLPEIPMTPRLADTRIGVFQIEKDVEDNGAIEKAYFVKRWRIEPKDTAAYFAGKLSEAVKPIVFYIENTFPDGWKDAIKAGILRWNKAFEKIGFKNVMQVRDFPKDDPNFDPDNFKYSCIRYLPTTVENAMGPSWVDPRTGEIINATVLVYNDVINTIDNWRFVQTAQCDPQARVAHMPKHILQESLEYVIAHEIGHTLGFMHNMAASDAFPTDSLRSATFTNTYGTTPSIMDYARFNYIAQPEDKGVKMTPPNLGVYDYYIVDWTYRLFPHSKGYKDDESKLNALIEKHAKDPMYRYGLQQGSTRYDPSSIEEDLSNDPVKAGTYGLKNLKFIIDNMDKWLNNDDDGTRRNELYHEILNQAYGYIYNVYAYIPGIKLYQTSESSKLPRYTVIPKAKQRAAALWLLKQGKVFADMGNDNLEKKLPYAGNRPFKLMAHDVQALSMMAASKLNLSFYLDSTSYSPLEYLEDVYQYVFQKTIKASEKLDQYDIDMQSMFVRLLKSGIEQVKQVANVYNIHTEDYATTSLNFGKGNGEPEPLWGVTVGRNSEFMLFYAQKLRKLLQERIKTTSNTYIKAHYMMLLRNINSYLK